jgi:chemotaxis protein CheX
MTNPTEDDLKVIAEQVWSSYLDVDGTSPLVPGPAEKHVADVTASVSVTGAWRGHVLVSCSDAASKHVGGALMGIDFDDVSEEDVADALGELANIIGGNVKSLLPEPCALSLPHVHIEGTAGRYPAVSEVAHLDATWMGESVTVTVLESTNDRAGAPV